MIWPKRYMGKRVPRSGRGSAKALRLEPAWHIVSRVRLRDRGWD